MSHVVVIGAGIGGLSAAMTLAAAGHAVTVCEAGPRVGGKAGIATHDGVSFDTGPSVVTLPHVFADLFAAAGTRLEDELTVRPLNPATRYHWPDGVTLDVAHAPADTIAAITAALGPQAAAEFATFLEDARKIWDAASPWFVLGDAPTPGHLLRILPRAAHHLFRIDPLRSMDRAIDARITHPKLRDLLRRFATYNGSDPRVAPATLNCIAWVELGLGMFGIDGGLHALAQALARVATRHGAQWRFHTAVRQIAVERGRATGVVLGDGSLLPADAVVVNADASHLRATLFDADVRHALPRPAAPSTSGWTGVLRARRRDADRRPAHAVLFPHIYDDEFRDLFDHDRAPVTPTVYLCAQEKAHGRTGWAEHEPVFVMANAPAEPEQGPRPAATSEILRDAVLARLTEAGLIDADDTLVWSRTPADLAAQLPGSRGAIYGAASNDRFAAFRRPPNRLGHPAGVYLASGSAHPGGGVPMVALSGRAAARAVLADLKG
jgi:phytoene desaturase